MSSYRHKIYLAGPMRGYEHMNFPMFDRARDIWLAAGWDVISPADLDREHGFTEDNPPEADDFRGIFARDFHEICFSDAIGLLPKWFNSRGAVVELQVSRLMRLHVYDALTRVRIPVLEHGLNLHTLPSLEDAPPIMGAIG